MKLNFVRHVWKIGKVLKLWRMTNLTVEGKKNFFKTLAISKIIHISLVTNVPTKIIKKVQNTKKKVFGMETIHKLKTPLYATNMKMVA